MQRSTRRLMMCAIAATFVAPFGAGHLATSVAAPARQPVAANDIYWNKDLVVGGAPIDFSVPDLAGQPVSLDDFKGKVLLIDFWATWCPPCREEVPNLVRSYADFQDQGFEILGISVDRSRAPLDAYIDANNMTWRHLLNAAKDPKSPASLYGVRGIPFSVLIGRDGRIAAINPRGDELGPAIRAALQN